jgi:2-polyprenyl-3-methyl-5-hydroxy-6-metoxy-1,4-benzoquinol methylase
MKEPKFDVTWPTLWKECYFYDCQEVFDKANSLGYQYAYNQRFNAIIDYVTKYLPSNSKLIDIAAAQGNFSLTLSEYGFKVTWNDLRNELVDYVRMKYDKGEIDYITGNIFDIQFIDLFDGVLITEIIEHVAHPDQFLKKISSLVKPNGFVFMSTPLGSYFLNKLPKFSKYKNPSDFEKIQFKPNSDGHIFLLYVDEIYALAKNADLEIVEWKTINNPLTSGHFKLGFFLKILPFNFVLYLEKLTQKLPFFIRKKITSNVIFVFKKKNI